MSIFKLKYKSALVILLISSVAFSQQKSKTEANSDIIEYTNKEGLPTTNIANIVQTKDGYIWISGIEGTYRFNGYEFEEVGKEYDLPKMQNMYYDSLKNILWFASPQKIISFDGKEFKSYSSEDGYRINGLPGQVISFINADSKGRIWIGSYSPYVDKINNGGLTKYENGKFSVYDSTNFPLDNATGFIETPYGDLIFSSAGHNTQTKEGSCIALLKDDKFKKIDESAGVRLQNTVLFPQSISNSIDKEGNTWLAFSGVLKATSADASTSGVLMYDGNIFTQFTDFVDELDKDVSPYQVYYSRQQDKLFLTTAIFVLSANSGFDKSNKSIFEFRNGSWKESDILQKIKNITELKSGKIIPDFRYTRISFTNQNKYFPELLSFDFRQQSQSSKYPGQYYSFQNGHWEKYDAFRASYTNETNDGLFMITPKGFGIYYPNHSKMLTQKDGLLQTLGGIPSLYTDKNGMVWISYSWTNNPAYAETHDVGLNIWDGKKLRAVTEKDGLLSNMTFNMLQDRKDKLWIPTSKGITTVVEIRNSEGEQILKFKNIENEKRKYYNTTDVLETSKGDIYIWQNYVRPESKSLIKADFFFGKYAGDKIQEIASPFSEKENSKKYQLFDLREDNDGKLWLTGLFADNTKDISSVTAQIMIYDGKKWSPSPKEWNMPNEQLHYVGNLKSGMYFLTSNGFYKYDGTTFLNLIDSVNVNADFRILKSASVVGTLTSIQAGENLYVRVRRRGIVIYDGVHLNFYTKKEGLVSADLSNPVMDQFDNLYFQFPSGALVVRENKFRSYWDDENIVTGGPYGSILDGAGNLVSYYNGVGLYINKSESRSYVLKLSSVTAGKQTYHYTFPKEYAFSQNSFVFNYSALNYKDPHQTNYEHFLEGFDKEWSRTSTLSFVEYQNLPPGEYTFKLKAITSNGIKTNEESYSFIVNPPWWMTYYAYGSYLLILVGLLISVDRIRKRKILATSKAEMILKEAELRAVAAESQAKIIQLENDRKSQELNDARKLQLSMLPKNVPQFPHLDIAVYMKTATEVGGDYYDFNVSLDGTLTVVLGDATGHGMRAGTMVTSAKSLFNSYGSNPDILFTFREMTRCIKQMQFQSMAMCLTMLKIQNNKLVMSAAGMPPVYVFRNGNRKIEEYQFEGMPLGTMENFPYQLKETELLKGDTILLMSDGFPELQNENGKSYGYNRARNSFEEIADKEPEEIITYLKDEGSRWVNDKDPDDDVTFVVIKIK